MGITVSWITWVRSTRGEGPEIGIFAGEKHEQLTYEMNYSTSLAWVCDQLWKVWNYCVIKARNKSSCQRLQSPTRVSGEEVPPFCMTFFPLFSIFSSNRTDLLSQPET